MVVGVLVSTKKGDGDNTWRWWAISITHTTNIGDSRTA